MRLVIFTSNKRRHKYFVNHLAPLVDDVRIFVYEKPEPEMTPLMVSHFAEQAEAEAQAFPDDDFKFPVEWANDTALKAIGHFQPDLGLVFGSSIIPQEIIDLFPNGLINLHLGMAPFYRGCATNFWPWVNDEMEYLGSTLLYLDSGIDTGDIIRHVFPAMIRTGDTVHSVGCEIIQKSVFELQLILNAITITAKYPTAKKQSLYPVSKNYLYKRKDFNDEAILKYRQRLK